jgi:hypothetical protein
MAADMAGAQNAPAMRRENNRVQLMRSLRGKKNEASREKSAVRLF